MKPFPHVLNTARHPTGWIAYASRLTWAERPSRLGDSRFLILVELLAHFQVQPMQI